MKNQQLVDHVYYVGTIDWSIRDFHGYNTELGSSYNAYLVKEDGNILIDTARVSFREELLERITRVIQPEELRYIIQNHAEPDHSGSLSYIVSKCPNAVIYTNQTCKDNLILLYPELQNAKFEIAAQLETEHHCFKFIQTGIHWPDSMVTYDSSTKILFSNDAFGQHIACTERFADQLLDFDHLMKLQDEYNANILAPFRRQLKDAVKALSSLDIKYILPGHGCGFRKQHINTVLKRYEDFAAKKFQNLLVIIFDTLQGQTELAIKTLAGSLSSKIEYSIFDIQSADVTQIARLSSQCSCFAFGCPTINNQMTANMEACLRYLRGLQLLDKPYCTICSFGWAEKSTKLIQKIVGEQLCIGSVCFKDKMSEEDQQKIEALGQKIEQAGTEKYDSQAQQ